MLRLILRLVLLFNAIQETNRKLVVTSKNLFSYKVIKVLESFFQFFRNFKGPKSYAVFLVELIPS